MKNATNFARRSCAGFLIVVMLAMSAGADNERVLNEGMNLRAEDAPLPGESLLLSPLKGCRTNDECSDPNYPYCDVTTGTCVECLQDEHCDNGDVCDGIETCDLNTYKCQPGTPLECDDGDICNGIEWCDPIDGCQPGTPLDCPDNGLFCDGDEYCDPRGGCMHTGSPCIDPVYPLCDEVNDRCVECLSSTDCPEGEECVEGICLGEGECLRNEDCTDPELPYCYYLDPVQVPGICVACLIDEHCDNNDVCDGEEFCSDHVCEAGQPLQCDDGDVCNGLETCDPITGCQPGTPLQCDDGDVCNGIETCDPIEGCLPGTPLQCDDGDVCNGIETCDPIDGCQAGTPLQCDDGDICNGIETCDPIDGCQAGTPLVCDDGDICNGIETCDPVSGCLPGTPLQCDDGDVCNGIETCDPISGCQPGTPLDCPDDGLFCNGNEVCDPVEGCVHTGDPCPTGTICNENTQECDPVGGNNPTYSVEVVEVNGTDVGADPSGSITADPGDIVTVEFFLRDWSPQGQHLRGYQTQLDSSGYTSGTAGDIFPRDWAITTDLNGRCSSGGPDGVPNDDNVFIDIDNCFDNAPAPPGEPDPSGSDLGVWGIFDPCTWFADCLPGGPCELPSIDWVLGSVTSGTQAQTNSVLCDHRHIGAADVGSDGPISNQDGTKYYVGTVVLEVSSDAEGTFTLCLDDTDVVPPIGSPDYSFIADENNDPIMPLLFECLQVTVSTGCASHAECDDGDVCNGIETCNFGTGQCEPGSPLVCDDGDVCNGIETCDPISGCQPGTPLDCPDDGLFCNGDEVCDPVEGCVHTGDPCPAGTVCNEESDICDPIGGCTTNEDCVDGDVCTLDRCVTDNCEYTARGYTDMDGDGFVTFGIEFQCALNAINGDFQTCIDLYGLNSEDVDFVGPAGNECAGLDGFVTFGGEIQRILDAINGLSDPCCGQ